VRVNREGRLFSANYGRIVAANPDPVEKKPLYHFLPGSLSYSIAALGCNFSCDFCQNWQISQAGPHLPAQAGRLPRRSPGEIAASASAFACRSVSYTYTEPLVFWEYALECMQLAREAGLANIVVSNGFGSQLAWQASEGLLQGANIDLKAFDPAFYRNHCGGRLEVVLDTLRQLKSQGVWLEITTLIIPGLNDAPGDLEKLASFIADELSPHTPWHISAYRPAYRQTAPPTGPEALLKAWDLAGQAGLKFVYPGNLPLPRAGDTRCPECRLLLVERDRFTVRRNLLKKDGICPQCGAKTAGVW
jgi:pyruvate formate lyase activating enzyme